jgi:hypothetical protein
MVFWLRDHLGSIRAVAETLHLPESTVRGYAYKRDLKRIPPESARAIIGAVLAHRPNHSEWWIP